MFAELGVRVAGITSPSVIPPNSPLAVLGWPFSFRVLVFPSLYSCPPPHTHTHTHTYTHTPIHCREILYSLRALHISVEAVSAISFGFNPDTHRLQVRHFFAMLVSESVVEIRTHPLENVLPPLLRMCCASRFSNVLSPLFMNQKDLFFLDCSVPHLLCECVCCFPLAYLLFW